MFNIQTWSRFWAKDDLNEHFAKEKNLHIFLIVKEEVIFIYLLIENNMMIDWL